MKLLCKTYEEYLYDYADFSFELRVFKELNDLGLNCKHSGTMMIPSTQWVRVSYRKSQ